MYLGEASCKIDNSRRLIIPSMFKCPSESFMLTFIDEDTLVVAKKENWTLDSPIKGAIIPEEKKNLILLYIKSHSIEVSTDKQRRLVIPDIFYEKLSFKRECLVIGSGETFQIVNKEKYYKKVLENEKEYEEFLNSREGEDFKRSLMPRSFD